MKKLKHTDKEIELTKTESVEFTKLPKWMDPREDINRMDKILNKLTELEKKTPSQKTKKKYQKTISYSISTINKLKKLSKKLENEGYYE